MAVFLILIFFFLIFFHEIFFAGKFFFLGDNLTSILPFKTFLINSLKNGIFPLWNPYIWNGLPIYADSTWALYSPFNIIYFFFTGFGSITISALLSYFLSFLGTYLFLKNEGLNKINCLIGGVIFAFSGSMINISLDISRLNTICFFPWILIAVKKHNFFWTVILLILSIFSGHFQYFYMPQVFIFSYIFFTSQKDKRIKNLFFYLLALFFSLAITFFQIWPQVNLIPFTTRTQAGLDYNTTWSLHPASIIRFFLADFWGRRNEGSFWGPDVTYSFGYLGFFPFLLFITHFKKIKKKLLFFAFTGLAALFISFGKFNPFYRFLLYIPGFSLFRNPSSWLIIYSFAFACLTAFLIQKENFKKGALKKLVLLIGFLFTFIGLSGLIIWKYFPHFPYHTILTLGNFLGKSLSSFHKPDIDRQICFLIARNLTILGLLSLTLYRWFYVKTFLIVVFLDLLFLAKGDLFLAPKIVSEHYKQLSKNPAILFLKNNLGSMRFVSIAEFLPYMGINNYIDNYFRLPPFIPKNKWRLNKNEFTSYQIYAYELNLLSPNLNLIPELPSINGYSTFILKEYYDYFSQDSEKLSTLAPWLKSVKGQGLNPPDPVTIDFDYINLDDPRVASLSVKYVLSGKKLEFKDYKETIFENGFYIYENSRAQPRAQVLDENLKIIDDAKTTDPDVNTVFVELNDFKLNGKRKLILKDAFYPGWKAFDNQNRPLKIYQHQLFRIVDLNNDTKSVKFKFEPEDFYFSLKVSGLSLVIFLTGIKLPFFKKKSIFGAIKQNQNRNSK